MRSRVGGLAALLLPLAAAGCGAGGGEAPGGDASGAGPAAVAPSDSAAMAIAIQEMLTASAASWNAGDMEGFLADSSDDPGLTFVGSSGVNRGKEGVRQRYLASYWAEGARRDSLRFAELEVRPLGTQNALALGRWILYESTPGGDRVQSEGRFSLVLRREGGVWRIIHDHSS